MWKNIEYAIYLMFIGMGVVFVSLYILMEFINAIGWLVNRLLKHLVHVKQAPGNVGTGIGEISPEEIAVITAAVYTVLQKKTEIHHICMLPPDSQESWSQVGRWDLLHSHDLRKTIK